MTTDEAVTLIGGSPLETGPAIWADLGCGEGTFTLALARLLPAGSVIHAMDQDARALRLVPPRHAGTSIVPHSGDFTLPPWPFSAPDGVLLANSLHFVADQRSFLRECADAMPTRSRILVVEYDTDRANPWVPYPITRTALTRMFEQEGYRSISFLGSRPSVYRRAEIYCLFAEGRRTVA